MCVPNEVHQADLHFVSHDQIRCKTYKYALAVGDVASRYKDTDPITPKVSIEVAAELTHVSMNWTKLFQVDPE